MFGIFLSALLLGISIAAPIGPIGVLCIHRTILQGRAAGFVSGLGAATADAMYGLITGLGVTVMVQFISHTEPVIRLIGGCFLLYLGVKLVCSVPVSKSAAESKAYRLGGAFFSTFLLTVLNPMTILMFLGVVTGTRATLPMDSPTAIFVLVGGVWTGSALWWLFLSIAAGALRERIQVRGFVWFNRISGVVLLVFAIHSIMK